MSRLPTFPVDETTLVFAFRYALGRRSTAPGHMVAELRRHWDQLNDWTQRQICDEITRQIEWSYLEKPAFNRKPWDFAAWQEVLTWPRKTGSETPDKGEDECSGCGRVWHNCVCSHDS